MAANASTTAPTSVMLSPLLDKPACTLDPTQRARSGLPVHTFSVARIMPASRSTRRHRDFLRRLERPHPDTGCLAV
jgi:hypothetical protein